MYYIYSLIDNRTNLPFYIGKGKIKNQRHLDHFKENEKNTDNVHKFYRIRFLKESGYSPLVEIILDNIEEEEYAYEMEEYYIRLYGRKNIDPGGILTNICSDKRPPSAKGRKQTKEHKEKKSFSYKNTMKTVGRKSISAEARKNISVAVSGEKNGFYGKYHSAENKKKQSDMMKGNTFSAKKYKFTSPDNQEYVVLGFGKFCRENGLSLATMEKILKKQKSSKYGKCKGWLVTYFDKTWGITCKIMT